MYDGSLLVFAFPHRRNWRKKQEVASCGWSVNSTLTICTERSASSRCTTLTDPPRPLRNVCRCQHLSAASLNTPLPNTLPAAYKSSFLQIQGLPAPAAAVAIADEVECLVLPRATLKVSAMTKKFLLGRHLTPFFTAGSPY